jgi:hypothetical protein
MRLDFAHKLLAHFKFLRRNIGLSDFHNRRFILGQAEIGEHRSLFSRLLEFLLFALLLLLAADGLPLLEQALLAVVG